MRRLGRRLLTYAKVLPRGRRNRTDLARWLWRRPAIALAIGAHETALLVSNRLDPRLQALAALKTSGRIGCPF